VSDEISNLSASVEEIVEETGEIADEIDTQTDQVTDINAAVDDLAQPVVHRPVVVRELFDDVVGDVSVSRQRGGLKGLDEREGVARDQAVPHPRAVELPRPEPVDGRLGRVRDPVALPEVAFGRPVVGVLGGVDVAQIPGLGRVDLPGPSTVQRPDDRRRDDLR